MGSRLQVPDALLMEQVARSGGYEEVEKAGIWMNIADSLGVAKHQADEIRARYEEMFKASAEADGAEDDEEDLEVETIVKSRVGEGGVEEFLVKWRTDDDAEGSSLSHQVSSLSWEPLARLSGAMDAVEAFREREGGEQRGADTPAGANGVGEKRKAGEVEEESHEPYVEVLKILKPTEGHGIAFKARARAAPALRERARPASTAAPHRTAFPRGAGAQRGRLAAARSERAAARGGTAAPTRLLRGRHQVRHVREAAGRRRHNHA